MRAGNKMYRGIEMPNVATFIIKSGQECYLSGVEYINNIYEATVYVFELKKFIKKNYKEIEKYL